MTTQIHIVNSSDSNPNQHSRVTFTRSGTDQITLLAPGENKGFWISGDANGVGDTITVVEVFSPKPAEVAVDPVASSS